MRNLWPILLIAAVAAAGLGVYLLRTEDPVETTRTPQRATPLVCTTLYPVHYLATELAGALAEVECIVPAGVDPLDWKPDAPTVQRLQSADLILFCGANAEPWSFALSLPMSRLVEATEPLRDEFIFHEEGVTHSHGDGETHVHQGIDPHVWMDPQNARLLAAEVLAALQQLLPGHETTLAERHRALVTGLDELDARFAGLGAQPEDEVLVASHPAYDYLARRYGWRVVNFDLDPGTPPDDAQIAAMRTELGDRPARIILWEEEPVVAWGERLREELGLQGVVFGPCETVPAAGEPDYLAAMRANAERLAGAW